MHGTRRRQKSDDEQVYAGQSRRAQLTVQGDPEKREQRFVERLVVPHRSWFPIQDRRAAREQGSLSDAHGARQGHAEAPLASRDAHGQSSLLHGGGPPPSHRPRAPSGRRENRCETLREREPSRPPTVGKTQRNRKNRPQGPRPRGRRPVGRWRNSRHRHAQSCRRPLLPNLQRLPQLLHPYDRKRRAAKTAPPHRSPNPISSGTSYTPCPRPRHTPPPPREC